MVFEDSRLNQTAVIISLYCIDSHHTALFLNQKLEECVFISLLPSSKSPFMSVRGEIRFPRAAAVVTGCVMVQNCQKTDKKLRAK